MRNRSGIRSMALAIAMLLVMGIAGKALAGEAQSAKVKVRVGAIRALGTVTPYIAERLGYADEQGLDVQIVSFVDGPTLMQGFAAGGIDIGYVGVVPAAVWWAKGIDLQVVASANGGGHAIMVRGDSQVKTLHDLRGKLLATPSTGSVTDVLLRAYILNHLVKLTDRDIKLLPGMAGSDMVTALNVTREVDAAMTWEPFISQTEEKYASARILLDVQGQWRKTHGGKGYTGNVVIVSAQFARRQPDALRRFLAVHRRVTDFINSDENAANGLISTELKLPVSVIERARKRTDFTYDLDIPGAMELMGFAKELGYIDSLPDPKEFFAVGGKN